MARGAVPRQRERAVRRSLQPRFLSETAREGARVKVGGLL